MPSRPVLCPQLPSPAPRAVAVSTRSPVAAGAPGPTPSLTAPAELPPETCSAHPQVPPVAAGLLWPLRVCLGVPGPAHGPPSGASRGTNWGRSGEAFGPYRLPVLGVGSCWQWGLASADSTFCLFLFISLPLDLHLCPYLYMSLCLYYYHSFSFCCCSPPWVSGDCLAGAGQALG